MNRKERRAYEATRKRMVRANKKGKTSREEHIARSKLPNLFFDLDAKVEEVANETPRD